MKKLATAGIFGAGALGLALAFSQANVLLESAVSQPKSKQSLANMQAWVALKVLRADPNAIDSVMAPSRQVDIAALKGQNTVLRYFFEAGAEPNNSRCTLLSFASLKPDTFNIAIGAGADPGKPECKNILFKAAANFLSEGSGVRQSGNTEVLETLLQRVKYEQKDLDWALHNAMSFNTDDKAEKLLIKAGANRDAALKMQ